MKSATIFVMVLACSHSFAQNSGGAANMTGALGVVTAVTNGVIGKVMLTQCTAEKNAMACAMAASSFAQAAASLASALNAFKTEKQITASNTPLPDGTFPTWGGDTGQTSAAYPSDTDWGPFATESGFTTAINEGQKALSKAGYNADLADGSVTDPSGNKHPISTAASGQAMLKEGLIGPEDAAKLDDLLKKQVDKFKTISMALGGGGGSGGGSSGRSTDYSYDDPYAALLKLQKNKPNAPKTEGLVRTLASGESIGAQTDNIFNMIRRRYEQKKREYVFVP